ncbi:hypothetical protein Ga0080574_TMP4939 (plasmid) [Salipiger abyssi]|uniref:Uncharacterized protein n=1 Tax=Salipiger abyssi TaxID=1250539 RepID=A0A1P8V0Q9_9RHOB|nr:hypothetical protein Ga0080574_TMP4939 [Salipiger abyssi]
MRFEPQRKQARFAVVAHIYYPEIWKSSPNASTGWRSITISS